MSTIVSLHEVSKSYVLRSWKTCLYKKPKITHALDQVSFDVLEGEVLGLLGPNGAGKTTILKILATLVTPDSGSVMIDGLDSSKFSLEIRKSIGMVTTNDRSFYWRLSGWDNLQFYGHLSNLYGGNLSKEINRVASQVGMEMKMNQQYGTYSSGERQRLAIARAMLGDPRILLMDEATANLDPLVSRELIQFTRDILIQKLKKTVIWCTHNLHEAEQICDRVTIINEGKLIATRSVSDLKQIHGFSTYCLVLSNIPYFLMDIEGFRENPHSRYKCCTIQFSDKQISELVQKLSNLNVDIFECKKEEIRLEDTFITLVQQQREKV